MGRWLPEDVGILGAYRALELGYLLKVCGMQLGSHWHVLDEYALPCVCAILLVCRPVGDLGNHRLGNLGEMATPLASHTPVQARYPVPELATW